MSDQSPPPKPKPGSLRDRIAAFENKGGSPAPPAPPPARPKPSGLQWKPKPPSPPTSPDNVQSAERKPPSTGGMSASDAMESIGRAGSLKERMAALQGKGAFGGPPPPIAPKPNVERPKWKPPPAVPVPASSEDEGIAGLDSGRVGSRSPPPRAAVSPTPESHAISNRDGDATAQEGDGGDLDPEEEERQRRAAIAARMARLGGARFGMGPPTFTPKPVVRKTPSELAPEVKDEAQADQSTIVKESSEALVTSPPPDLPATTSLNPEPVTETERKDDHESPPSVPTRAPVSMPMPAGPRRAAPPRKKVSKNAPAVPLPEPPVEETEATTTQIPSITNEPPASVDRTLSSGDLQEIGRVVENVEATHGPSVSTYAEQRSAVTSVPIEAFHAPVEEPEKQETEEEHVESAGSDGMESTYTAVDDQGAYAERPPETFEADEEEEEARRQRVAAKLAQIGAFNPFAGPPLVPSRQTLDEPAFVHSEAPLDVEDEVNVDTEEIGVTIPPPPVVPSRQDASQSIKHDVVKVEEDVPAHRDDERAIASYATGEQGDGHHGHTLPCPEFSEDQPIERDSVHTVVRRHQATPLSTQEEGALDISGIAPLRPDVQEDIIQGDTGDLSTHDTTAEIEHVEIESEEMPPPRITRPVPPPPVNLRSKPTPPASPPLSPPPQTTLQALRVDEEECPPSPDIPPRPIPPPGRSGSWAEDVSPPPRRSILPPPRRTSVRMTDAQASPPSSPPPVPTAPRPVNVTRRTDTPFIITTLAVQEQAAPDEYEKEHVAEEETSESVTPRPNDAEDEAATRRRAIAERMARLGAIQFGAPPLMNPLSRPPLPSAPPPTSIPPDELEEETKEQEGVREEEEEDEVARKQRIAAKLAGMGGMRLGMLPPPVGLPPASARRPVSRQEDSENEDAVPPVPIPAPPQRPPPARKPPPPVDVYIEQEASEQTRRVSRGMSDDGVKVEAEDSELEEVRYSDAEVPEGENAPRLPPSRRSTQSARSAEALPTPPPRMTSRSPPPGRPPIPTIPSTLLGRRSSARSVSASSSRQASLDESSAGETPTMTASVIRSQSEYVMVEAEDPGEDESPPVATPPRRKSTRGGPTRTIPALPPVPPPSAIDPPEAMSSSAQWELPSIPQGAEFGEGSELASSGWSEDSTAVHIPAPMMSQPGSRSASGKIGLPSSATTLSISGSGTGFGSGSGFGTGSGTGSTSASGRRSLDQQPQLTTDELMTIWGKTGTRVAEAAKTMFEKSKRALVGDGSYAGLVRAVLAQVPGVAYPSAPGTDDNDWGYVVYAQMGNAVQRRMSDILPGDVIVIFDAKFKGHKGLQPYTQTAGATAGVCAEGGSGGPLVGIVSDFEGKKSKVRVWQANQHVGQQTVEIVSYRLEDLKSGQVKVYRVLEA